MKFALLCVLAFTLCTLHAPASPNKLTAPPADSTTMRSEFIKNAMLDILQVTGLRANFELKEARVRNIEASISHRKRYILYNPEFIDWVNRTTSDKWGTIALLAHEIGHHLNGHTIRKGGSKPKLELEADEFAGFVLYKLGASLQQSQEVMNHISSTQPSSTHPGRVARQEAIREGWLRAKRSA
jgi:hypothetical protein